MIWTVAAGAAAALASWWALGALSRFVWRPRAIARAFRTQGVGGPHYRFLVGNILEMKRLIAETAGLALDAGCHDYGALVQPYFHKWMALYGRTFVSWFGETPELFMGDVNMVKQVLSDRTGLFTKNPVSDHFTRGLGKGLILIDGDEWKRHRKVVHPVFNLDKLKMLAVTVSGCVGSVVSNWETKLEKGNGELEIEVSCQFGEIAANVISHVAFGNNHKEAKEVHLIQKELQHLVFSSLFNDILSHISVFRYLPTKNNLKMWRLQRKVRSILINIIESRLTAKDTTGYGNDMLGVILEACTPEQVQNPLMSIDEIIEECKTFYLAGHETTTQLLTWTMFLLSTHEEWQEMLREEVLTVCGNEIPTGDMLNKLKLVNMFILETLRLYAPVSLTQRIAGSDIELNGIRVPKGTILTIPVKTIHRDKELWGEDADEFKPKRFENGATRAANHPNAFVPFSSGPRACVGQNFAMIEVKVVMAMILQKFSVGLSPKYVHAPMDVFTICPKYGLPVVLRSL
ncbi:Secologanin synthase [Hordeum vulgare]|nr:Secologanin synthase [Hordeum vulgare]